MQAYVNEPALRLTELQQTPELREKSETILHLSEEMTEKLQHLCETPFDPELKQDLLSQAKALRRDSDLLDGLIILNPEMAQEMERLIQGQQRSKGIER